MPTAQHKPLSGTADTAGTISETMPGTMPESMPGIAPDVPPDMVSARESDREPDAASATASASMPDAGGNAAPGAGFDSACGPSQPVAFFLNALAALAFMSRLGPARLLTPQRMARSVLWFPFVGIVLGALALIPYALGLWRSQPALSGLVYVAALAWLTRGLHWDGFMDLADALGSNARGERFWEIMKDSRVGAFAAIALFFLAAAQVLAAGHVLSQADWPVLVLVPLVGRSAAIGLMRCTPPWPGSTLARSVTPGATTPSLLIALAVSLVGAFLLLGALKSIALCCVVLVLVLALRRMASMHGGQNGDVLGASILLGETATLLVAIA